QLLSPLISTLLPYTTLFRSFFQRGFCVCVIRRRLNLAGEAGDPQLGGVGGNLYLANQIELIGSQTGIQQNAQVNFPGLGKGSSLDRKSTRLNSSHVKTSYAV